MFKKSIKLTIIPVVLAVLGLLVLSVQGQNNKPEQVRKISLLIIDETKTIGPSMKIEALARGIKKTGLVDLSAKMVDVTSSYAIPVGENKPVHKYDLILIFPRGLDEGTPNQVWILSSPINHGMKESIKVAIKRLSEAIERIFQVEALDVSEDLIPALLAKILIRQGWLAS